MQKKPSEILNDKVTIAFEFNRKSPLFAKKASIEIEKRNFDKAIEILNKGISLYPDYPVPYFILSKALALNGDDDSAKKNIKTGSGLIRSKKTYEFYLSEIENIRNKKLTKDTVSVKQEFEKPKEQSSVDERLEEIAKEITSAKIQDAVKEIKEEVKPERVLSEEKMIVSDTLAKIYVAQGELKEAIKVYEKLLKKDPSKENYYLERIKDLKLKSGN